MDDFWTDNIVESRQRFINIAKNPYAAALFFDVVVHGLLKELLCAYDDKIGILGNVKHFYGTVETQGCATLHLHLLIWCEMSETAVKLRDRIEEGDELLIQSVNAYFKKILNHNLHKWAQSTDALNLQGKITTRLLPPLRSVNDDIYRNLVHRHLYASQVHRCCSTCYKYASAINKRCRFRFPKSLVSEEEAGLHNIDTFKVERDNEWINACNTDILVALGCNNDLQQCLFGTDAQDLNYYVTDYITKMNTKSSHIYTMINSALKSLTTSQSFNDSNSFDKRRKLIIRCLN